MLPNNWIHLSIGGGSFFTTRSTLERSEYFENIIRHSNTDYVIRIDRDGTHFRYILNYLRGSPYLPEKYETLYEIAIEADFYCLHELREAIFETIQISLKGHPNNNIRCRPGLFESLKSKISPMKCSIWMQRKTFQ